MGDLARISGASERAFGWRDEAIGFARDHYRRIDARALLGGADPGEILIFGDSFSLHRDGGVSWINTLRERTGLEARFVRIDTFETVLAYLRSDAFRRRTPRAILVQSVERGLADRARALHDPAAPCSAPPPPDPVAAGVGAPLDLPRRRFEQRRTFEGIDELFSWGALAARLRLTGGGPVLMATLTRRDLFSHRDANRLLMIEGDVALHLPSELGAPAERAAAELRCGLRRLAAAQTAAPLWLMIAPDKRTVYAPWIADPLPAKALDLFAEARAALGPALIDLQRPLRSAAGAGVRDLYWPNDTHWGAAGHRLAGETAAAAVIGEGGGPAPRP